MSLHPSINRFLNNLAREAEPSNSPVSVPVADRSGHLPPDLEDEIRQQAEGDDLEPRDDEQHRDQERVGVEEAAPAGEHQLIEGEVEQGDEADEEQGRANIDGDEA